MEEIVFNASSGDVGSNLSSFNSSMFLCERSRYYQFGRWREFSPTVDDVLRSILIIFYVAGCLVGASLNLFVIVLVIKFKKLHRIDFYITLQIVLADLFFCIILFPISATNAVTKQWAFNPGFCHFAGFLGFLIIEIRSYFLFILSLDRLCSVFLPLRYPMLQKKVVMVLSFVTWMVSISIPLVPLHGLLDCYSYAAEFHGCTVGRACKNGTACDTFAFLSVVFLNSVVVVALVMYFIMFCKAKKVNARVMLSSSVIGNEAAALQQKHSKQAIVTLAFYFTSLFALSSPQLFLTAIPLVLEDAIGFELPVWYNVVHITTVNLVLALSFVDPIVLMRNGDIREVYKKVLRKMKEKMKKHVNLMS